jgi:hypothetical protein
LPRYPYRQPNNVGAAEVNNRAPQPFGYVGVGMPESNLHREVVLVWNGVTLPDEVIPIHDRRRTCTD